MAEGFLQGLLSRNWFLVFFIYGLSYFLMGFSIALQTRRSSTFRLARHLWLLACFGLLHGMAEWAYIFYLADLRAGGLETLAGAVLSSSHAILIALSFVFLFVFGLSLTGSTLAWPQWPRLLPVFLFAVWIWIFVFRFPADGPVEEWLGLAEIVSRYSLALPGAVFTSIGLYLQRAEIRGLHYTPLERALLGASLIFAFYGFAGGIVVPYAAFFPASLVNTSLFLQLGLPVQFMRAAGGVFMAYFVIRSLGLYEIESRRNLENLRRRELVWLEKDRIRRDLHDGVVQAIYGLSLGIGQASRLMKENPGACAGLLKELEGRSDTIIEMIRCYLEDLKPSSTLPENPVIIIEDLLADFTASTGIMPTFRRRGVQENKMSDIQLGHFYHMAVETLSNVRRHAGAAKVEVYLDFGKSGVRLNVKDNGVGFLPAVITPHGMGLDNLRVRAALGGGWVDIKSAPAQGTEVDFWLPYSKPEEGEGSH